MMTKRVVVTYRGNRHIVDVPCEPSTTIERCKELAIQMLKRKDEIRETAKSNRIRREL